MSSNWLSGSSGRPAVPPVRTGVGVGQETADALTGRKPLAGARRAEILVAATERFGRDGYEDTKWADIAADVGVGPTALYHYFDSKEHCLFVIMEQAIEDFHSRFQRFTSENPRPLDALLGVLLDCFELDEQDIQRNRLLVAELGLLTIRRHSPREEQARQAVSERIRTLEFAWATFLARAMEQGAIAEADPRLLARAILGLYNSIWHWYRPNGTVALHRTAEFYVARLLALLGVAPETAQSMLAA
jgi:AcrR family transcriptional regulator